MPSTFQISAAHLQAFSDQQRTRFEDEMLVYLRENHPVQCREIGEPGVRELIREGIRKGENYNIVLEADVARYIEFMLIIAPDFDHSDETPWAQEILTDRSATGVDKLNRIRSRWTAEGSSRPAASKTGNSAGGSG